MSITEDEYETYFDRFSNWGRWGADDRLGTLNLITPQTRLQALTLAREGAAVSLARDLDPTDPDPHGHGSVAQRYMTSWPIGGEKGAPGTGVGEFVGIVAHGSTTHLDGLGHVAWHGRNYNGFPVEDITSTDGSVHLSMHQASQGILTRGVLLDIPALTGRDHLDPGEAVGAGELSAAEQRQKTILGPGDAVFLYTGRDKLPAEAGAAGYAGYGVSSLSWLKERDVAVMSSDGINDTMPSEFTAPSLIFPVHCVAIVAMGIWVLDNASLAELHRACAERGRWEFLFVVLPWRMVGVTSSAVNPVALF